MAAEKLQTVLSQKQESVLQEKAHQQHKDYAMQQSLFHSLGTSAWMG